VVEDDEVIRAQLVHRLSESATFRQVDSYPDAESALANLPTRKPDVVLMDINLPRMDGIQCVRQLKAKMPQVQFIMLTVYEDSERLFKAMKAGASGYLLKRTPPAKLLAAIQEAHEGGSPMTPQIARLLAEYFWQIPKTSSDLERLTAREEEVLDQLSKGFRYKEIAANLGIVTGTLYTHIASIYRKLHVHSRTEAVVKYLNR
jgi:DNA-binding NarL/FixJ family response regulator